jgi:hypothetical protein
MKEMPSHLFYFIFLWKKDFIDQTRTKFNTPENWMHFSIGKQTHNLQKTDHYKTLPLKGNNTATAEQNYNYQICRKHITTNTPL